MNRRRDKIAKRSTKRFSHRESNEHLPNRRHTATMPVTVWLEGTQEGEPGRLTVPLTVPISILRDGTRISCEGYKMCWCPKHMGEMLPMSEFGYRRMGNGLIRPQAYCKETR